MPSDIWQWLNFVAGLLFPLFSALCAVFCYHYRRLSSWLLFAAIGFLLESGGAVIESAGFQLLQTKLQQAANNGFHVWVRRPLCDAVAFNMIFVGLLLAFIEASRRMRGWSKHITIRLSATPQARTPGMVASA